MRDDYLISNRLRNRNTIEFLGLWERLNNPDFNPIEFDGIKNNAGLNSFILTAEAPIHANVKQVLLKGSERDTNLIFRTMHNTSRVFKNAVSDEVVAMEKKGAAFEEVRHLVAGARGRNAMKTGDVDAGIVSAGMVIGLIDDLPTCKDLIERIVRECRASLAAAGPMAA